MKPAVFRDAFAGVPLALVDADSFASLAGEPTIG